MTTRQAVPNVGDVVGAGIDALVVARPKAAAHIEHGNYGDVIEGWRSQFELARARLADEFVATRLQDSGKPLTELCASNYDAPRREEPTAAIGSITLHRSVVHFRTTSAIATPDATDGASVAAMFAAIKASFDAHMVSVYSSTTGLGAHILVNGFIALPSLPGSPLMTVIVSYADVYRQIIQRHYENREVDEVDHDEQNFIGNHVDPDIVSPMEPFTAFASDAVSTFDASTQASKQSVLRAVNALKRSLNTHYGLEARAGAVRKGTRFDMRADPVASPPISAAQYVSTRDIAVPTGGGTATIPVEATTTGPAPNTPLFSPDVTRTVLASDALFDDTATLKFSPTGISVAGGAETQGDEELRRAAKANWSGRYGPTVGALLAGALAGFGASRTLIREDVESGSAVVFAADETWAQSAEWLARLRQTLSDPRIGWLGFGCKMATGAILNLLVRLELTVVLKDGAFLTDTSAIMDRIQKTARAYFDDRADWFVWRASALRAAFARCDARIMTCSQVLVLNKDNEPLVEPSVPATAQVPWLTHYYLADNPVSVTFTIPS